MQPCTLALPFRPAFTLTPEATSPLLHPSPLLHSWPSIYSPSSVSFISLPSQPTPGSTIPFTQRPVTSFCPFPSLSPDQKLSICFPVSLCIIFQSLSSHPVTVCMCFYSFQPVITDYFYFAGTHSELLPPFNAMALL